MLTSTVHLSFFFGGTGWGGWGWGPHFNSMWAVYLLWIGWMKILKDFMPYSELFFPIFAHFSYHKARETSLPCNNFAFVCLNSRSFKPVRDECSNELLMRPRTFYTNQVRFGMQDLGLSMCIIKDFKYSSLPFSKICLKQNWKKKQGQVCMLCKPFRLAKQVI